MALLADLAPVALLADQSPVALLADLAPVALLADLAPVALLADLRTEELSSFSHFLSIRDYTEKLKNMHKEKFILIVRVVAVFHDCHKKL